MSDEYSEESFLDEQSSSINVEGEDNIVDGVIKQALSVDVDEEDKNKESFLSALENLTEVSSPLHAVGDDSDDHEDEEVVVTCMSTIEEESKSNYESSTALSVSNSHRRIVADRQEHVANIITEESELNASGELRELHQLVNETETEFLQEEQTHPPAIKSTHTGPDVTYTSSSSEGGIKKYDHGDEAAELNVEAILRKLEQMQNTQDILEQVINTDITIDADHLTELISKIPFVDTPLKNVIKSGTADHSERSVSAEIASIQKIIDAGAGIEMIDSSNSLHSEVAGGNNLLSTSETVGRGVSGLSSPHADRDVDDVLREYDELERSFSRASAIEESFASDISSLNALPNFSNKPQVSTVNSAPLSVPAIKPPILKSVVPSASAVPRNSGAGGSVSSKNVSAEVTSVHDHFDSQKSKNETNASRTKPMSTSSNKSTDKSKSSRDSYQSNHNSPQSQPNQHSARPTMSSSRDNTQDAYKPRNRRMRSPRTIVSPKQSVSSSTHTKIELDKPKMTGAGENYHHHHHAHHVMRNSTTFNPEPPRDIKGSTDYAVAEALTTIQKLSTMVERQEILLGAYSKDNEKLWTQLKDAKSESLEKESNFQDVINSLRTEVASLKLNRLVASSTSNKASRNTQTQGVLSPPVYNRAELERLREDGEVKSRQVLELRKEVLLLQTKLVDKQSKPPVPKSTPGGGVSALVFNEKEKEYHKEIGGLKKQVRTLQKILYSKDATAPPPSTQQQTTTSGNKAASANLLYRTKSDIIKQNMNSSQQNLMKTIKNTGVDTNAVNAVLSSRHVSSSIKGVNMNTSAIIQASLSCIDQERHEFEKIIEDKNKLIYEKEKAILTLKEEVESLKGQLPDGDVVEPGLVDELRSRIITQNNAIHTLKEHLCTFKKLEAENLVLREDKHLLEQQIQELRRKLDFAQHLVKPENEVLCMLSEKVDELNSRYHLRERQLDTLLSKLTLKTTTGGGCGTGITSSTSSSSCSSGGRPITTNLSPRRIALDQFSNNNSSLGGPLLAIGKTRSSSAFIPADMLHMGDFSPSNSFH